MVPSAHRRLQSCVGAILRLGYAAFDARAIAESVFCHNTVRYTNERSVSVSACVCLYKYRRVLVLVR